MGFDRTRIVGNVDEELICPICADVLKDPVQSSVCEHSFCRACIETWLQQKHICPVDRQVLEPIHLVGVSRLMRNMLSRLRIKCLYADHGCTEPFQLQEYPAHLANCQHNPKLLVPCNKGCGQEVPKDQLTTHNCVLELGKLVQRLFTDIRNMKDTQEQQLKLINSQRHEIEILQYYIEALRSINPVIGNIGNEVDRYSLMQWGSSLPLALVHTWGSLISTPDADMHGMVRNMLCSCGCPMHLVNQLVDRCHEDNWPIGLGSLETRRENYTLMTEYVTHLLPTLVAEKPCVVILGCDNEHMPENLRPTLGLIMVFVDGVDERLPAANLLQD